jgi:uncharacterized protein
MKLSKYTIKVDIDTKSNIFIHGISGAVDIVSKEIVDKIESDQIESLCEEDQKLLIRRGYLVHDGDEGNRRYISIFAKHINNRGAIYNQSYLFIPTYDCNLRCPYCFEAPMRATKEIVMMNKSQVDAAYSIIDNKNEIEKIGDRQIILYGGEPLLTNNYSVVKYIFDEGKRRNFYFFAVTNGTNLECYEEIIAEDNFTGLQITVDGLHDEHDKRRPTLNGDSSFKKIINTIDMILRNKNTKISIRINVDKNNCENVKKLIAYFKEKGYLSNPLFSYYFSQVSVRSDKQARWKNTFIDRTEMWESLLCDHDNLIKIRTDSNIANQFYNIFKTGQLPFFKTRFCGANFGTYIFDPFGDLYCCWDVVGIKRESIGTYYPKLEINKENQIKWTGRTVDKIDQCMDCPYIFFCAGGCESRAGYLHGNRELASCDGFPKLFNISVKEAYSNFIRSKENEFVQKELSTSF